MKINKFWKKTDNKAAESLYCSECGCELISTNKNKICDNCQRNKASKIKGMLKLGTTVITTIGVIVFKSKNKNI